MANATTWNGLKIAPRLRWKIRYRLLAIEYAQGHGLCAAGRHFGLNRKTIRDWRDRWRAQGVAGLVPRYEARRRRRIPESTVTLIAHARRDLGYGTTRTRIWLQRVHQISVAVGTIRRVARDLGLPRPGRRRKSRPRQLKLFECDHPGDCVQIDVKYVRVRGQRYFQYTAIDDCTRYRVLRLYQQLHQTSSLAFLAELRRAFPFPIRKLQCDNGFEFPLAFALEVMRAGIAHRYIRPRRPQQNGKVERSHRIDNEEFWSRQRPPNYEAAVVALREWEQSYNSERFSMALKGRTPAERLADFHAAA